MCRLEFANVLVGTNRTPNFGFYHPLPVASSSMELGFGNLGNRQCLEKMERDLYTGHICQPSTWSVMHKLSPQPILSKES